ncbi:hypothetical protein GPA10_13910 [Streptomyces sp. p1417]|uniref:Uncharacterized protein n=1 Tax=Streptomyces typhae TaxID=2681492 RepID=A0A6L6WU72_9ACTN|nr:hypothetical protein [Streptomyces typhae]MVO85822.1 hypothetical protein [Streptomyces typhae]
MSGAYGARALSARTTWKVSRTAGRADGRIRTAETATAVVATGATA